MKSGEWSYYYDNYDEGTMFIAKAGNVDDVVVDDLPGDKAIELVERHNFALRQSDGLNGLIGMKRYWCQWCRLLLDPDADNVKYAGKGYHERCFSDLVKVAHRTRSVL